MKKHLGLFFLMLSSLASATTLTHKLDLEHKIAEKVRTIVSQVDLQNQVLVEIGIKKITTALPGTGSKVVDMFSVEQDNSIDLEDIDRVNVTVLTRLQTVPVNIQKEVSDVFSGQKNISIKYNQLSGNVAKILDQHEEYETQQKEFAQGIANNIGELSMSAKNLRFAFVMGLAAIIALGLLMYWMSGRRAVTNYKMMAEIFAEKIGAKLGNREDREAIDLNQRMMLQNQSASRADSTQQLGHESSRLEQMTANSLAALLSDCYWCREDAYAMWLWGSLSPQKHIEILSVWPKAELYVRSVSRVEPRALTFHNNLYFLKPLPIYDVSQEDLKFWVGRYKGSWNLLSPVRQAHLNFTLQEKIEFSRQAVAADAVKNLPKSSTDIRELEVPVEIGALTENDELEILKNPASVPEILREDIISLVWVALLPPHEREVLLSGASASFLAEIWVGPTEILQKLEEVIPEKKQTLLKDYLQRIQPRRDHEHFTALSREAIRRLAMMPKQVSGGESERKAS